MRWWFRREAEPPKLSKKRMERTLFQLSLAHAEEVKRRRLERMKREQEEEEYVLEKMQEWAQQEAEKRKTKKGFQAKRPPDVGEIERRRYPDTGTG